MNYFTEELLTGFLVTVTAFALFFGATMVLLGDVISFKEALWLTMVLIIIIRFGRR